ncbi:MAG: hypothetical protein RR739_11520 [Clostridia bacterium]
MLPRMDPMLREMFLSAYQFLQARQVPTRSDDYWQRAADDMLVLSEKYQKNALMDRLLCAVYEYLDELAAKLP